MIDIVSSALLWILFVLFYSVLIALVADGGVDESDSWGTIIIGFILIIVFGANIFIQTILNIASVKNKIKSCVFFAVLISYIFYIDCIYLLSKSAKSEEIFYMLLLSLVFCYEISNRKILLQNLE